MSTCLSVQSQYVKDVSSSVFNILNVFPRLKDDLNPISVSVVSHVPPSRSPKSTVPELKSGNIAAKLIVTYLSNGQTLLLLAIPL